MTKATRNGAFDWHARSARRWRRSAAPQDTLDELRWLNQYTSYSLGTMAAAPLGSTPLPPPPAWLAGTLPAPFRPARLAVDLHYDAEENRPVLHFAAAADGAEAIDFPTPLPANLHVQCQGEPGNWHVVGLDKRVRLPMARTPVWLTTLAGRRYELLAELPAEVAAAEAAAAPPPLYLSHLAADREQARSIADWLSRQGIGLQLIEEESLDSAAAAAANEGQGEALRVLRLWTRAAQAYWAEKTGSDALPGPRAALLRTEALAAPPPGQGAERLLELLDWQQPEKSEEARNFLEQLRAWLADEQPPPEAEAAKGGEGGEVGSEAEALLAELADPETPPPRRLKIGDRLAEIGDPRRGVGVREFVRRDGPPPRRLVIGDRLAEIGDPRRASGSIRAACPRSTGSRSRAASSSIRTANGARCRASPWRVTRSPTPSTRRSSTLAATAAQDRAC
jgi:hypothetical protein